MTNARGMVRCVGSAVRGRLVACCALLMIACSGSGGGGTAQQFGLNISGGGSGSGIVTATAGDVSCTLTPTGKSGSCLAQYDAGTVVVLTATAASGSEFTSWGGGCSGTTPTCQLTLTATVNVQANFGAAPQAVVVTGSGSGTGSVSSSPAGLSCTAVAGVVTGNCSASFASGSSVVLTALASPQSVFDSWSGDCAGALSSCSVIATASRAVQARFLALRPIMVIGGGAGSGSVTSTPSGINCAIVAAAASGNCSQSYVDGTPVTLNATPAAGSAFVGWSGGCTGAAAACALTASTAVSVTATFVPLRQLAVTGAGAGAGTVTSTPAGVACSVAGGATSGACLVAFPDATSVTLAAVPTAGSSFGGWSGDCSGTASCVVAMSAAHAVTALFSGASSASTTTVVVSPLSITAGGAATVTVTVRDAGGAPVVGTAVTLSVASGPPMTITQPAGVTDSSGVASGTVSSTVAGQRTVAATLGGTLVAAQQPLLTVTPAVPSAATSTVSVNTANVIAGGSGSPVTVTVRDGFGNPVPGVAVTLSVASGPAMTIIQPVGVTGANGVATGTVSSTTAGARMIAALAGGAIPVAQQGAVTVLAAAPAAIAQSGAFTATGARFGQGVPSLPAVIVTDAFGNPVAGAAVVFTVTKGLATLGNGSTSGSSVIAATDASGVARLTSWVLTSVAAAGNYDPSIDVNNAVSATLSGIGTVAFTTAVAVSYAADLQSIWSASVGGCTASGCHPGSGGSLPVLVAGASRASLLSNPAYWSSGDSTTISSGTNKLLCRLTNAGCGTIMPSGFMQFPANIVGIIKAYIKQGVPDN